MEPWVIYFDGACSFNPGGIASFGWRLLNGNGYEVASDHGEYCRGPEATCNVAEYAALGEALRYFLGLGISAPLICRGDSRLVVEQVCMRWKCKKPHLARMRNHIRKLLAELNAGWTLEWVPRERNAEADRLSKSYAK